MFDTIILVTGPDEQVALSAALRGRNPQLAIRPITAVEQFTALEADELARSRLIAFATPMIVPAQVLDGLGFCAYNFHPGPPRYPGWAPAHFALYERASEFGATAHVVVEKVDAGPIVSAVRFPIPPQIDAAGLEGLAYGHLARMFRNLAEPLARARFPTSRGIPENIRAAPTARSAIFRSTSTRTSSSFVCACSAPTISASRQPFVCMAWSSRLSDSGAFAERRDLSRS